ncbi:hypothetical protein [Effusibacillus dendaii]|uniref:CobQ/CobB/MinD/ParA nucleotide binding domain-containing protein n=1 Tax=Effusibacillus dendaii TaxID=2743772 RepID=A0A7I8DDJ7_9BACL|nr:hypothetical protein [Effusibacillus dendaii]BCJ88165.1 hypothetical protein skT53_31500 [Effusibacillus dendaii]
MKIAILAVNERIGQLFKSCFPELEADIFTDPNRLRRQHVVFMMYRFASDSVRTILEALHRNGNRVACFLQEADRAMWETYLKGKNVKLLVNGFFNAESVCQVFGWRLNSLPLKRSFAFASAMGGAGKTFLSLYLARKLSVDRRVRLVDWNCASPVYAHFFRVNGRSADLTAALGAIRNGQPVDLHQYETDVQENLTLSGLTVNYSESSKWTVDHFSELWDLYQKQVHDVLICEVPNHPLLPPATVALLRFTDIVIPLLPDPHTWENTLQLVDWIRAQRVENPARLHLVLNRRTESYSISNRDLQKLANADSVAQIPEIANLWSRIASHKPLRQETQDMSDPVKSLDDWMNSLGLKEAVLT